MSLPSEEQWRPVVGYEGRYEVSDRGRVRSLIRSGYVMRPALTEHGYRYVTLSRDGVKEKLRVHRLALAAFDREPLPGEVCRHLDGDPANNRLDNLAWGSQADNMQDMVRHGRHKNQTRSHCRRGHLFDEDAVPFARKSGPRAGQSYRLCRRCEDRKKPCPRCGKLINHRVVKRHQRRSGCLVEPS